MCVLLSAAVGGTLLGQRLDAQENTGLAGDSIRGSVRNAEGRPLAGAQVFVTDVASRTTLTTISDSAAAFSMWFRGGMGTYVVVIQAPPYPTWRRRVKRDSTGQIVVAATMAAPPVLQPVRVSAARRNHTRRGEEAPDVGNSGGTLRPEITADQQESIAGMAATLPQVHLVDGDPHGRSFSVLGLGPDQNRVSLNGMSLGLVSIPRDAAVGFRLNTSSSDVSHGGFSGGEIALNARQGMDITRRALRFTFDDPSISRFDGVASSRGQLETNVRGGGLLEGPLGRRAVHATALEIGHRRATPGSLLGVRLEGTSVSGLSETDRDRFIAGVSALGMPDQRSSDVDQRSTSDLSLLSRIDLRPSAPSPMDVTLAYSTRRSDGINLAPTSLPTVAGRSSHDGVAVQLGHARRIKAVLHEPRIGLSRSSSSSSGYWNIPRALVRVLPAPSDSDAHIVTLAAAGAGSAPTSSTHHILQLRDQLSWFTVDNRHRLNVVLDVEQQGWRTSSGREPGTFVYNSIDEFLANSPASFTRRLQDEHRDASQTAFSLSVGDAWRAHEQLRLQFGVRLDGNRMLLGSSAGNGLMTGSTSTEDLSASPRLGLTWVYGAPARPGRAPGGTVRAGFGRYVNRWGVSRLRSFAPVGGDPNYLTCVGAAVPIPDWTALQTGESPVVCASSTAREQLLAPDYVRVDRDLAPESSWRGNLSWSGQLGPALLMLEGIASLNERQQSLIDANLRDTPQFLLADEADRPVFAAASAIVPSTGVASLFSSRRVASTRHSWEIESRLRGSSEQASVTIAPAVRRPNTWSLTYMLGRAREQHRGTTVPTSGDPRLIRTVPATFDVRHRVQLMFNTRIANTITTALYASVRSGVPFTPLVAGDVNGDGVWNDAAFVFGGADTASVNGAERLSALVREHSCLAARAGAIAATNKCRSSWTASVNMHFAAMLGTLGLPRNVTASLTAINLAGGLDALLHSQPRGWGQPATPDPYLLAIVAFDSTRRAYRYSVNPRFGRVTPLTQLWSAPFRVLFEVRMELGQDASTQQVGAFLKRGRGDTGQVMSAGEIKIALSRSAPDPIQSLFRLRDSLMLSDEQEDRLRKLRDVYLRDLDAIWTHLAAYLSAQPKAYDRHAAADRARRAQYDVYGILKGIAREAQQVLGPDQWRLLSGSATVFLDPDAIEVLRRYFKP